MSSSSSNKSSAVPTYGRPTARRVPTLRLTATTAPALSGGASGYGLVTTIATPSRTTSIRPLRDAFGYRNHRAETAGGVAPVYVTINVATNTDRPVCDTVNR